MTSEIDKLKHFHIEDYSGTNFTDNLKVFVLKMLLLNLKKKRMRK